MTAGDLAVQVISTMNSRDLSALENHLAEDACFDFPGAPPLIGRKRILTFLKVLFRKYPSLRFETEDTFSCGDKACVIWSNSGKNSRGEDYKNRGVTIVTTKDGFIHSISDYFKDTAFTADTKS